MRVRKKLLLYYLKKVSCKFGIKIINMLLCMRGVKEVSIKINNETFTTLSDYLNDETKVDKVQKAQIEFKVELIGNLIDLREKMGLSNDNL